MSPCTGIASTKLSGALRETERSRRNPACLRSASDSASVRFAASVARRSFAGAGGGRSARMKVESRGTDRHPFVHTSHPPYLHSPDTAPGAMIKGSVSPGRRTESTRVRYSPDMSPLAVALGLRGGAIRMYGVFGSLPGGTFSGVGLPLGPRCFR